jgi:hypothetical protein
MLHNFKSLWYHTKEYYLLYVGPYSFTPTKILDNFYLGCIDDAYNSSEMENLKVTHLITVIPGIEPPISKKIEFLNIPLYDETESEISNWFEVTFDFIEKGTKDNNKTFVHCMAGVSRSGKIKI